MSWQTSEAVRDASATRGAARAVAFAAATYADKGGAGIFPSNKTLRGNANAARNTVRDALEWMCGNGEAELVRRRRLGNPEYSFAPLHARLEQIKYWLPIFEAGGSTIDPLSTLGGQPLTPGGQSTFEGGQSLRTPGSVVDPEPLVKSLKNHQEQGGLSPFSQQTENSPSFERGAVLLEALASWRSELPALEGSRHEGKARSAIAELEGQLDRHLVATLAAAP